MKISGLGAGLVDPQKKDIYLKKFCPFYVKLCTYTIFKIWNKLIKISTNVFFVITWWRHHESHVLTILRYLGIDVFLLLQTEFSRKFCMFCVSSFLINSRKEKFSIAIINVNFHTFKICQESVNYQLLN